MPGSQESIERTSVTMPVTGETTSAPHEAKMSVAGYEECPSPQPAAATLATGTAYGVADGPVVVVGCGMVVVVVGGGLVGTAEVVAWLGLARRLGRVLSSFVEVPASSVVAGSVDGAAVISVI